MRLISYLHKDKPGVGIMVDELSFIALPEVAPDIPDNLRTILELKDGLEKVREVVAGQQAHLTLDEVVLEPVIPRPNAIWALALNYIIHQTETGLTTSSVYPHVYLRQHASVVGHGHSLLCPHPDVARAYDYEGEFAVIIGRGGRHIPVDKALEHVAGYSIFNEGSVREFQHHNRQFGLGKNFEASGSFGPWLMTADDLGDPYEHKIITRHNGKIRQKADLAGMIFKIPEIINYLSTGYALRPGDVIVTGSPGQLPPEPKDESDGISEQYGEIKIPGLSHLEPGDHVEVEVPGLGILRNPVVGDDPAEYKTS